MFSISSVALSKFPLIQIHFSSLHIFRTRSAPKVHIQTGSRLAATTAEMNFWFPSYGLFLLHDFMYFFKDTHYISLILSSFFHLSLSSNIMFSKLQSLTYHFHNFNHVYLKPQCYSKMFFNF